MKIQQYYYKKNGNKTEVSANQFVNFAKDNGFQDFSKNNSIYQASLFLKELGYEVGYEHKIKRNY